MDVGKLLRRTMAAAQKAAGFVKESAQNIQKNLQMQQNNQAWKNGSNDTSDAFQERAALKTFRSQAETKQDVDLQANKEATIYHTEGMKRDSAIAGKAAQPDQTNDILCYTIAARQMIPTMTRFKDIIKGWITKGIMSEQLGYGPFYSNFIHQMSCGQLDSNDPSYANNDPSCATSASASAGTATGKSDQTSMPNANISFETLMPGKSVLIMPPLVSKTIPLASGGTMTAVVPQAQDGPDKERQQKWIAARDYCYNLVGGHPDAPSGKALDTPEGRRKMAAYSNCASMQSEYVSTCAEAVAYITRPNCADNDFKPFCEKAKQGCQAAFAHNVVLPASFDQCSKGLSLYEAEYISNILCMSNGRATGATASGATADELDTASSLCLRLQTIWQKNQDQRQEKLLRAIRGLNDLRSCWKQVE